jgi:hypothetical protein
MVSLEGRLTLAQFRVLCVTCCKCKINFYEMFVRNVLIYPDGGLSGGGDCSLEEGGEGHNGGEENGELHFD